MLSIIAMQINRGNVFYFSLMCVGLASSQNATSGMIFKMLHIPFADWQIVEFAISAYMHTGES